VIGAKKVLNAPKLRPRIKLEIVREDTGEIVLDDVTAKLLILIKRLGSLLKASKALGMPYSRAWECIARIERTINGRVIEARRGGKGGGGTTLTALGEELIKKYIREYIKVFGYTPQLPEIKGEVLTSQQPLTYVGSHDIVVGRLAGIIRKQGTPVEAHWLGSLKGLAALLLGEGDVAGVHLLDYETGEYNVTYARRILPGEASIILGYERLQVLASREGLGLEEALDALLKGELRLANRVYGSGTRTLMKYLLMKRAKKLGINPTDIESRVKGYNTEFRTHDDVAMAVSDGRADVGLLIEGIAKAYGLHYVPVTWERFDFIVRNSNLESRRINAFINALRSRELRRILDNISGYRYDPRNLGRILSL